MELEIYKKFSALEKRIKSLEQQVDVLQDFTGLRETIKKNLERAWKERAKENKQ